MCLKIRKINQDDLSNVLDLIIELAVFEKESSAVELTLDQLKKDFSENLFDCLVAEHNEGVIGMALFYNRYSTWKGKTIHLEDLIVTNSYRGKGVGKLLLDKLIFTAKEQGVKRVEWNVLDWNEPAISFYKNVGAKILRNWLVVQLDENGIKSF